MPVTIRRAGPQETAPAKTLRVMGIDPSTFTGIVVLSGEVALFSTTLNFPALGGFERLQMIANTVAAVVNKFDPDVIFIEKAITGGKFNAEIQQHIGTLIRDRLYTMGKRWSDVTPTTLKKWTTGKGRADKASMRAAATTRWGFVNSDHNIVDAYCLARLAQHVASNPLVTFKGVKNGS